MFGRPEAGPTESNNAQEKDLQAFNEIAQVDKTV